MKLAMLFAALMTVSMVGCSTRATGPGMSESGVIIEGDGGGDGGGSSPAVIAFSAVEGKTVKLVLSDLNGTARGIHVTLSMTGTLALVSGYGTGGAVPYGVLLATDPNALVINGGTPRMLDALCTSNACPGNGSWVKLTFTGSGTATLVASGSSDPTASPSLRGPNNEPLAVVYGNSVAALEAAK